MDWDSQYLTNFPIPKHMAGKQNPKGIYNKHIRKTHIKRSNAAYENAEATVRPPEILFQNEISIFLIISLWKLNDSSKI